MKALGVVLSMLLAGVCFGQVQEIEVTPLVEVSIMDSLSYTLGSDTVVTTGTDTFVVVAGEQVWGYGVTLGTTVDSVFDTKDTLILSANVTATVVEGELHFGFNTDAAYTSGDWMGLPFEIAPLKLYGSNILQSVLVTDTSDQIDSFDIVFFNSLDLDSGYVGNDNAAVNVSEADVGKIVGYLSVTNFTDLGQTRVGYTLMQWLPMPSVTAAKRLYGRMIARSAPNFTSCTPLTLRFNFAQ